MKRLISFFIIMSIIFLFSGCNLNLSGTSKQLRTVSKNAEFEKIKFNKLTAYFGVSRNNDTGYNRYLFFYGNIETSETDNNRISDFYNQKYNQIDFYDEGKQLYSSKDLDWTFNDVNDNEKKFTLAVSCKMDTQKDNLQFDKIVLHSKEEKQTYEIGSYNVFFYDTAENKKLSCVESPIFMQYPDEKLTLSYAVMIAEKTTDSKYDFHLEPERFSHWQIDGIEWFYDEELTNQLKTVYSSLKTNRELESLKAYRVNVYISVLSKTDIAIKPIISAEIDGKKVYCTTEPLFLKF